MSGTALHTYLLSSGPLCLALDPADRALYVGYEDGSIQLVEFYKQANAKNPLHDPDLQSTPSQPPAEDRWLPPVENAETANSPVHCIDLVHDGTLLVSGHNNGKIHTWDIAKGKYGKEVFDLSAPITSLIMLPLAGFPKELPTTVKLNNVVKPRYESFANGSGSRDTAIVPTTYTFTAQFTSDLPLSSVSGETFFHEALNHPFFPATLLEEGIAEFSSSRKSEGISDSTASADLQTQNASLASQLEDALKQHRSATAALEQRDKEEWRRNQDEDIKAARKKKRRLRRIKADEVLRKKKMGEPVADEDEEMANEGELEEGDLSSSTDEMSDDG